LGDKYKFFCADFKSVQHQLSREVFETQYRRLRELWPEARPYLDDQLTPNVRYWAAYNHDRFTTEAVSTQRGEGLNRHLGEEAFDFAPVDRSLATADPNLVDHPRCITADRLREELPVGAESARGCPVATSGRCLALSPVRPSTQAF